MFGNVLIVKNNYDFYDKLTLPAVLSSSRTLFLPH